MVLSFKISKTGTRYKPKPKQHSPIPDDDPIVTAEANEFQKSGLEKGKTDDAKVSSSLLSSGGCNASTDAEVSFILNIFLDGYSIVKPTENLKAHRAAVQENPKLLLPYDRASETFFAAIESGRVPGDLLNDIPCKYVNGTIVCEVQDYRKCTLETGPGTCIDGFPTIHKISLRMSLENIVKDIPAIADGRWSYRDLMEVESRILKTLQPNLCLDPTPNLDRLCEHSAPKLNLDIRSMRKKRLRQVSEVTVTCHTNSHGKKVCIDRVSESSSGGLGFNGDQVNVPSDMALQQNDITNNLQGVRSRSYVSDVSSPHLPMIHNQPRYQMSITNQRLIQEHGPGAVMNTSGAPFTGQDILSYMDNSGMSSLHGNRENHDGQQSPLSSLSKRPRPTSMGVDTNVQQHIAPFIDGFQGQTAQWKNSVLQQQFQARGIQYASSGGQRYSQTFDGLQNQEVGMAAFNAAQGTRFVPKEEQIEMDKLDRPEVGQRRNDMQLIEQDTSNLDPQQLQFAQRLPQNAFNRPGFSQAPWNNLGQQMEKREEQLLKRKSAQSPRVSAGSLAQSPLSSKSGDSLGAQYGVVTAASSLGAIQKDNKAAIGTAQSVGGLPYMTSSGNDSLQRQQPPKRRTNSLPKTQALSGVASPASVSTTSVPPNVNSPSIGTPPMADQTIIERFTKLEMVANKFNLNAKKNKVDNCIRKSNVHSPQMVAQSLSLVATVEDIKDDSWPLSKSIVSGSMNAPKSRMMNFMQPERMVQGSVHSVVPRMRTRLLMAEKSNDGTVAMHFGEIDDGEFIAVEDYLQTLPNAHKADLLASQYCSLMIREGCLVEDYVQLKPMRLSSPPNNQPPGSCGTSSEAQQYAEADMSQAANKFAKPSNSDSASMSNQNLLAGNKMLPPGNQTLQMSQGHLTMPARSQQLDQQSLIQQQTLMQQQSLQSNQNSLIQQQQSQFQRPPLMMGANTLSHLNPIGQGSNMQLGNHMANKPSPLQMQMLQQQQQQQQQQQAQPQQQQQAQAQMQRKLLMGLGNNMGMGNIGNNLVGLGALGNVMNMGTGRGIGGVGISSPAGPIAGVGNIGQNPLGLQQNANINAISQQLRSGQITPQQATLLAAKMRMYGRGMLGQQNAQPNLAGARQMHPSPASLAMLGQLNRANINPMQQRAGMGPMGPPKLMAGMNPYMNQQLQLQQQQQQQIQQQQQFQLQQQQSPPQSQQQLQQQPPHETASPLQAVVSPPPPPPQQVSSPSASIIMPQTQMAATSPQQISQQRTPMSPQLSSGAIPPPVTTVSGNPDACPPGSPQLSSQSQTLGSVGSISNSPMELQGVTKSNSNT